MRMVFTSEFNEGNIFNRDSDMDRPIRHALLRPTFESFSSTTWLRPWSMISCLYLCLPCLFENKSCLYLSLHVYSVWKPCACIFLFHVYSRLKPRGRGWFIPLPRQNPLASERGNEELDNIYAIVDIMWYLIRKCNLVPDHDGRFIRHGLVYI